MHPPTPSAPSYTTQSALYTPSLNTSSYPSPFKRLPQDGICPAAKALPDSPLQACSQPLHANPRCSVTSGPLTSNGGYFHKTEALEFVEFPFSLSLFQVGYGIDTCGNPLRRNNPLSLLHQIPLQLIPHEDNALSRLYRWRAQFEQSETT